MIGSVDFQFALCAFMAGDAVQQHHFIQLFITEVIEINVRAGHGIWGAGIAILDRFGQRVFIYHIFERHLLISLGHQRCRCQFQSQQRMQFVQRLRPFFCPVMVRLIHNEHKIRQVGQRLIERVPNELVHLFHVCALFVEFVDVIHEDVNIGFKQGERFFTVIVIRNDLRRRAETAKPLEHILGTVVITEILFEFFKNRGIGSDHEKVSDMVLRVQVGDKCTHQTGLADAGCQSKSQGHKVTLKIGADRIHSVDSAQCRFQIHSLAELYGVCNFLQNLQRLRLRLAEGHDAADIVCGIERKIVRHPLPPRRNHHTPAGVRYSGCNPLCRTRSVPAAFAGFSSL